MGGNVRLSRDPMQAVVTFSNPGKLNAFDTGMWLQLETVLEELGADLQLRCLTLRGDGDQAFSSGADISEFDEVRSSAAQAQEFARPVHRCFDKLRSFPAPTLAAIEGVCAGGGLELAACCDLRVCSRESRFGIPINKIGATLSYAELEVLVEAAGPALALELLLEGRMLTAEEALTKGLVTRVTEYEAFETELQAIVRRIAAGGPLAARWHKRAVRRLRSPEPLSEAEIQEGYSGLDTEDYRQGYRAFLAGKRAVFEGR
jgi:enoyl-CoA hydratase/carnithine racemase